MRRIWSFFSFRSFLFFYICKTNYKKTLPLFSLFSLFFLFRSLYYLHTSTRPSVHPTKRRRAAGMSATPATRTEEEDEDEDGDDEELPLERDAAATRTLESAAAPAPVRAQRTGVSRYRSRPVATPE